jgi:hypothetical protein
MAHYFHGRAVRLLPGYSAESPWCFPHNFRVARENETTGVADAAAWFRWRDSAHHNEQKLMTVSVDEFLRCFLPHLLPEGFVRIRHFGFLANRQRFTVLPLAAQYSAAYRQTNQGSAV